MAVLQAPDLVERLRVLPTDARSICRPRRPRLRCAQEFELDEQAGELLLEVDEVAGGGGRGGGIARIPVSSPPVVLPEAVVLD